MRSVIWKVWAGLFALMFLLLFVTKFTEMLSAYGIPLLLTTLSVVGFVACMKLARQADERTKVAP